MIFTKLRIAGFKSFVDPIEFLIEPGRTGIVGPNGCGKSNLVEAIRWVMGESSYKNMRASGMDEVIFSGSLNRPSRNTADVTLFIDNSDRTAPAIFNDADTLEVTRRIEREAGSVYRINGKDVRARDVQLLFADASTGSRSPSMVRQGQIGELISAKPQARRAILEEAAGISGLYSRRHEAELRLRAAETNLDRLEDVLNQLQVQLDSLKRQARQASRYRNLSGDIRQAESALLFLHWIAAQDAMRSAEEAHKDLTLSIADKSKTQSETARAEGVARHQLPGLLEAESKASAALHTLNVAFDALEAEKERSATRLRELEERLKQLSQDFGREERLVADYRASIDRLSAEKVELKSSDHDVDAEQTRLKAELAERDAVVEAKEKELSGINQRIAAQKAERTEIERTITQAQSTFEQNTQSKEKINRDLQEVAAKLGADDTIKGILAEISEVSNQIQRLEKTAEHLDIDVQQKRQANLDAAHSLQQTEQDLRAVQAEADTLSRILNVDNGELWPPLIDALQVESGLELALGVALGDDLNASSDENAPSHWRAIDRFADNNNDPPLPDGCIVLSDRIKAPDFLNRRLRQVGLVDREKGSDLQVHLKAGQRLVSKEGDLWRWDGFVVAANAQSAAAMRLENQNRLTELVDEAKTLTDQLKNLRQTQSEAVAALESTEAAAKQARVDLRRQQDKRLSAQQALTRAEQENSQAGARKATLEEALKQVLKRIEDAEASLEASRRRLDELPILASEDTEQAELKAELAESRALAAEVRASFQGHQRDTLARQNRLSAIARDIESWKARLQGAAAQIETLRSRIESDSLEKSRLEEAPDNFASRRQALMSQISKAENDRSAALDARSLGETTLRDAEQAARQALNEFTQAREEQVRAEERLTATKDRVAELVSRIDETMQCAPAELQERAGLNPDSPLPEQAAVERRLERYKSERERLGGVNLRADEESKAISDQHDQLVSERDDLIEAIRRLRTGIASLNREGRERLLAAFEIVNNHFQHLFSHLFGGGQAELKLTESDDPLEAGLEIIARPPGKKPQTMTLLSGGEQALTALSLIFAVFLTNPAPLCVLDEVDAPLDDANVERFCALVDEMSRQTETRFVIVTHNPITMAEMDRLFGVTMAERGVSQLVSVDLQGAEEYLEVG